MPCGPGKRTTSPAAKIAGSESAALVVDDDADIGEEARLRREAVVRDGAGADHDEVGANDLARARLEGEAPVASGLGGERRIEADIDAVATMFGLDQRRGLLVAHPREDARRDLDDGDRNAKLAGGSRDLEADQAAAHHREMPGGLEPRGKRIGMSFGAQIVDPRCAERQHR